MQIKATHRKVSRGDLVVQLGGGLPPVLPDPVEEEVVPLVHLEVVHLLLDALHPVHQLLDPRLRAAAPAARRRDLHRQLLHTAAQLSEKYLENIRITKNI